MVFAGIMIGATKVIVDFNEARRRPPIKRQNPWDI
jgi:hypothetical protein